MRQLPFHASRRNNSAFFLIKRLAVPAALAGVMSGRTGVSTIEPPSCTLMLTRSPTFMRAKSIRAASNISPRELPILHIVLTMTLNYVLPAALSSQLPVKRRGSHLTQLRLQRVASQDESFFAIEFEMLIYYSGTSLLTLLYRFLRRFAASNAK
jgi:hypothetical protein